MNIFFPARKKNGKNYDGIDEIMGLIQSEPHGTWLAGTNTLWHGGIHLSEVSAPGSVLNDNADIAVPLQCMADGEVIAWRLNRHYLTNEYNKHTLQYSSTFVLIKSLCKPDPDRENSWLEFFSLYIGLAPLCDFTSLPTYQVTEKGNGLRARRYTGQENGGNAAPMVTGRSLKSGDRVVILRQESFQLKGQNELFGLAQPLEAGKVQDDKFWISMREAYLSEEGLQYGNLPDWMHHAVEQGVFDAVVKPAKTLTIAAGGAVGFLAKDIDPIGQGKVDTNYFAHVEVLSTDARMPAFLNNPENVTSGVRFIRIPSGKTLYSRWDEGKKSTFTAMSCVVGRDSGKILPVDKCHPYKDSEGKTWYEISPYCWMSETDVDLLHQYDLKALGFTALEEGPTADMSASLREGWMKSAFGHLSDLINRDRGIKQQYVSDYYKKTIDNIDSDGNDRLSGEELFRAMHHPEMEVRDIVARMVVKHDSEWFGDSCQTKWVPYFKNYDRLRLAYSMKWRDDMEWMSHVAPFSDGSPVWHMHPVKFLDAIGSDDMDLKWMCVPKGQLTFDSEGNDIENSIYFSRHPHVPNNKGIVIGVSGVTFGRGLDLGQQSEEYIKDLFIKMDKNVKPLSITLKEWLIGGVGKKGAEALNYCNKIDQYVPKTEQFLTRKQQHYLFNAVYEHQYEITRRVMARGVEINGVMITANIKTFEQDVQDVLVDLTFRGDNSPRTRRYFMKDLTTGRSDFKKNISNLHWKVSFGVPTERFNSRRRYL